jgi:uncharacterized membrane protein YczE
MVIDLTRTAVPALAVRLVNLYVGLVLFGISMAMLVEARLGLIPWDVLHQGISRHTGWTLGTTVIVIGFVVLLLWIPLRERPGFGTVSNVVVIGLALDETVRLLPTPSGLAPRIALVAGETVCSPACSGSPDCRPGS